jgi:hypothetical protein
MNFMEEIGNTIAGETNLQQTENGALGYKTTGRTILDMNFRIPSYREHPDKARADFQQALKEDPKLALKWLFYARDVRGGLGERDLFTTLFLDLYFKNKMNNATLDALLPLIAEYGRWGDVVALLGKSDYLNKKIVAFIYEQLTTDLANMDYNITHIDERLRPVSLLAKWLPSINTSSKESRQKARLICKLGVKRVGLKESSYRKILSKLRSYLNVVEVKMSGQKWGNIDYSKVPSKANLLYNKAFFRHDPERRAAFINKAVNGEVKINSSVTYPYEILHNLMKVAMEKGYCNRGYGDVKPVSAEMNALEAMWKQLPNYQLKNTIVVADGSGSMTSPISKSSVSALEVANSLAIYFAERLKGEYANKYISFSEHPQLVDLSSGKTLFKKMRIAMQFDEIANTDIEAVFDLILNTALKTKARQEDIPANILIISDMEFDDGSKWDSCLFENIEQTYRQNGYKLPKLIFWNVNSRTNTIPMKENDNGFALVSGFSLNIFKMITSGKLDPMEALRDVLLSERYEPVKWYMERRNF